MSDAVAELARMIEEASGNVVPPAHLPFLAQAAGARVRATGQRDLAAYVAALRRGTLDDEWRALLPLVTVNESYFFRTPQQFQALARVVLPDLLAARAAGRRLRLWSAGCARGEEPGTLALVLAELPELAGWDWRILATDVDEEALADARRGIYAERAVAQVAAPLRERHFTGRGEHLVLSETLRARIDYRSLNLVHEPLDVPGGPFDIVFLRNVLIYFRVESQRRVAAAIAARLAPDGVLFLGPAETLWQISAALEPVDLGDCFCYRRSAASTASAAAPPGRASSPAAAGRTATRARPPARSPRAVAARDPRPPGTGTVGNRERLEQAVRHLLEDRLAEAVELLDSALATDPSEPAAHFLEGFLHDLSGRTELAIASFRAALYLDPALFQARVLLADALRRLGWEERARVEYRAVLARLAGGDCREPAELAALPLPDRAGALRRARAALQAG